MLIFRIEPYLGKWTSNYTPKLSVESWVIFYRLWSSILLSTITIINSGLMSLNEPSLVVFCTDLYTALPLRKRPVLIPVDRVNWWPLIVLGLPALCTDLCTVLPLINRPYSNPYFQSVPSSIKTAIFSLVVIFEKSALSSLGLPYF